MDTLQSIFHRLSSSRRHMWISAIIYRPVHELTSADKALILCILALALWKFHLAWQLLWTLLSEAILTWVIILRDSLWRQDCVLAKLVMQWCKLVDLTNADFTIKHAERVMRIALATHRDHVRATRILKLATIFKALVSLVFDLVDWLVVDQVLELALCKLRSRMSAVSRLTIVASVAHVKQAFIQLVVTHLISREVHVLAVGQNVVERLFL